jgi:hypothetical protein
MGNNSDDSTNKEVRRRKRKRHRPEDRATSFSSSDSAFSSATSSSTALVDENPHRRHRQKQHTHKTKKKKRNEKDHHSYDDDDTDESSSSVEEDLKRKERKRKPDKKEKKKKKKDKKKKKEKRKRHRERRWTHRDTQESEAATATTATTTHLERNYRLADALCQAVELFPDLYDDLSIMLIRLAAGAQLDLSQSPAAAAIANILHQLKDFGVVTIGEENDDNNPAGTMGSSVSVWKWNPPPSTATGSKSDELVLIRVVRALLDEIGFDMNAIETFENEQERINNQNSKLVSVQQRQELQQHAHTNASLLSHPTKKEQNATTTIQNFVPIQEETNRLLQKFHHQGNGELSKELVTLCQLIMEGECIALDGLPDPELGKELEMLLQLCGLVKLEMEPDDDDDDDPSNAEKDEEEPTVMGYGLPEMDGQLVKEKLSVIMEVCANTSSKLLPAQRVKGPMRDPGAYENTYDPSTKDDSSIEDEGPLPLGSQRRTKVPSDELVQARAAKSAQELACAKQGLPVVPDTTSGSGGGREEWMLVPGKFDLLNALKSGPQLSRQFQNKKSSSNHPDTSPIISDSVRAEIMAIRQAHEEARGPSLMEQHREAQALAKKQQQLSSLNNDGSDPTWKWNRDKNLDSGRRVDKDALKMILGGAGKDLKTKFHSSV